MICKFCGNEIDNGSDFCFICGQKVEAEVPAYAGAAAANADVYSQPAAPAQPAAPVTEQPAAPEAPAASAPVQPAAPAPMPASEPVKLKKNGKPKNPANGFLRFICVILPAIGQIIGISVYSSAKKKGQPNKAVAVLNSTMRGLCLWMAVIVVVMFVKFVLG